VGVSGSCWWQLRPGPGRFDVGRARADLQALRAEAPALTSVRTAPAAGAPVVESGKGPMPGRVGLYRRLHSPLLSGAKAGQGRPGEDSCKGVGIQTTCPIRGDWGISEIADAVRPGSIGGTALCRHVLAGSDHFIIDHVETIDKPILPLGGLFVVSSRFLRYSFGCSLATACSATSKRGTPTVHVGA
jgi:hypothetical protein